MSAPAHLFDDPVSGPEAPAPPPTTPRRVRLGMPHLDVGGLSEGWLLRHAGDLHWEAIARRLGVATDEILDEAHQRIYPTVVALRARYDAPLSEVRENDSLEAAVEVMPCGRACAQGRVNAVAGPARLSIELVTTFALRQTDGTIGYSPNLRHGVTGKGLNDYHAIFRILAQHQYRGWISIEDGMNGMDEMAESLAFLRRMGARYFPG